MFVKFKMVCVVDINFNIGNVFLLCLLYMVFVIDLDNKFWNKVLYIVCMIVFKKLFLE